MRVDTESQTTSAAGSTMESMRSLTVATGHHRETGHPIIRSTEPGEDWSWCYLDEVLFRLEHG
jgi:hypothetical protein